MTRRAGAVSLAELILALLFFGFVMVGAGEFLVRSTRLAGAQRDELRFMELARTARVILGGELRSLAPADIAAASPDSLRIRAFRGGGVVCGGAGRELWLHFRGGRAPDAAKDSVVLIRSSGTEEVLAVDGVSGAPCGGDALSLVLEGAPGAPAAYALLFESGAYHVADGALRYRRGAGGRQPLTEALLLAPAFARAGPLTFDLTIGPRPDSLRGQPEKRRIGIRGLNAGGVP